MDERQNFVVAGISETTLASVIWKMVLLRLENVWNTLVS